MATLTQPAVALRTATLTAALGDGREMWLVLLAAWNSGLVLWAATLASIRRRHNPRRGWPWLWPAGLALTAFTYPVVICVLPSLVWDPWGRGWYLVVAETFAPVAECLLFGAAFGPGPTRRAALRDAATIVLANLASFGLGELASRLWPAA